jgi:hypothetical protein
LALSAAAAAMARAQPNTSAIHALLAFALFIQRKQAPL